MPEIILAIVILSFLGIIAGVFLSKQSIGKMTKEIRIGLAEIRDCVSRQDTGQEVASKNLQATTGLLDIADEIRKRQIAFERRSRKQMRRLLGAPPTPEAWSRGDEEGASSDETKGDGHAEPGEAQESGKKATSLFFVSLPKSGTVFTWNSISRVTGLAMPELTELEGWKEYQAGYEFCCPEAISCGDYNTQMLRPDKMERFMEGYVFGSHMPASFHNVKVLETCGIDKVSLLLRDPRDAFVSWIYHLNKLGAESRNYNSKIYHLPERYFDWELKKQISHHIRVFLPSIANWIESWLDLYADRERNVSVQILYYDELKTDPTAYVRRILDYQGVEDADYSKVVVPEPGKLHFRKGTHGQWREEFPAEDLELVDMLLEDRIQKGFDRAARKDRRFSLVESRLEGGENAEAAEIAYELLEEFPNYRPLYDRFADAVDGAGATTTDLRTAVASTLGSRKLEDLFIYRYALLEECRNLLSAIRQP